MGETVEITDWNELDAVREDLGADYTLMNDLTPETEGYDDHASENANEGEGWLPIGDSTIRFTGTFDGQGYVISDLYIDRPEENFVGLFGWTDDEISNIGMIDVDVSGGDISVGELVGVNSGTVSNSYATGNVSGGDISVGGLVGENRDGGTVENSYATGNVSGDNNGVGGLVGWNRDGGTVENSYAIGDVSGEGDYVGGLVGGNSGTVSNSYATGNVSGTDYVGGLVGSNIGTVKNSYATGTVNGTERVGGLVGYNSDTVENSYATGEVSGDQDVGSLVGDNRDTVSDSFALHDPETPLIGNQQGTLEGRVASVTEEQLKDIRLYKGDEWDEELDADGEPLGALAKDWDIEEVEAEEPSYPYLNPEEEPVWLIDVVKEVAPLSYFKAKGLSRRSTKRNPSIFRGFRYGLLGAPPEER